MGLNLLGPYFDPTKNYPCAALRVQPVRPPSPLRFYQGLVQDLLSPALSSGSHTCRPMACHLFWGSTPRGLADGSIAREVSEDIFNPVLVAVANTDCKDVFIIADAIGHQVSFGWMDPDRWKNLLALRCVRGF
jgi:hypothetical protein